MDIWLLEKTHLEAKGRINIAKCVSRMVCAERSFYMDAYFWHKKENGVKNMGLLRRIVLTKRST